MPEALYPRRAMAVVGASMDSFRAVVLQGARQVGKSTLAQAVADARGATGVSLDDVQYRSQAHEDPSSFVAQLGVPVVIDEVQRGGDPVVLAIKQQLDASRAKGQYLLTGSSNFLTTPMLSESLAGRIDLITLWPLSVGETADGTDELIERAFDGAEALLAHRGSTLTREDYLALACRGGYPEALTLPERARRRWYLRYLDTVLRREVVQATDLRRFDALQRLARTMIATTGAELVTTRLAGAIGVDRATIDTYEAWLETTFLLHRLPAWSRNAAARTVRRPKIHVSDTGLAAAVLGKDSASLARRVDPMTGPLMESFVIAELAKQIAWSDVDASLYHLRETSGLEIDAVVEAADGRVVAVEVKTATTVRQDDAAHLARLRERLDGIGSDFVAGIVLHTGHRRTSLGDRLVALPIAVLWTG